VTLWILGFTDPESLFIAMRDMIYIKNLKKCDFFGTLCIKIRIFCEVSYPFKFCYNPPVGNLARE